MDFPTLSNQINGGLRRRWIFNILFVVVPLAIVAVFAVTAAFASYYIRGMESDLKYRAQITTDFFADYMNVDYNDYYRSCVKYAQTYVDRNDIELQFINANGKLVVSSYGIWAGKSPETTEIGEAITNRKQTTFLGADPHTDERIMAVSSPLIYSNGELIGVLRFVTSVRRVDRQVAIIAGMAVMVCGVFLLVLMISTSYFIRSIVKPVEEITAKAQHIAAGSYGAQIKTRYNDEIGVLAETINDLSTQIGRNEKTQSEFISSLSHELRTPLTAITGWGETLIAQDEMDSRQTRRGMGIILREARRLTEMVEELLDFTRIQDGRMTLNVEEADLLAEFEDTVFMYGSRLKQEGITLNYQEPTAEIPLVSCDPKRLRQVFLNILDNAAKHGGAGKAIDASVVLLEESVVFRIRDHGPGIPEDELPLVKKKFYKGSSKARGSGIGLAVCDEIVHMHGGTLELRNAPGGGTLVSICLPLTL